MTGFDSQNSLTQSHYTSPNAYFGALGSQKPRLPRLRTPPIAVFRATGPRARGPVSTKNYGYGRGKVIVEEVYNNNE